MDVEGEEVLDELRRCVGWKYGSCAERPIKLSTGSPSCTDYLSKAPQKHVNVKEKKTYPPAMLDQLFPVDFVEPRYPDELSLRVDESAAQLLVLAAHGHEHVFGTRRERVG